MFIYTALLIPLVAIILLAIRFSKRVTWWEYLITLGIPTLVIILAKFLSTVTQTVDQEYWNNYIVQATYYERWNEWIHKTCYHTCYDRCKDSNGRSYDCNPHDCRPYDCSYEKNHPAYWEAVDNQGRSFSISSGEFSQLCQLWGNKTFKNMNRSYYTIDGDAYVTSADTVFDHTIARTTLHTYENRVKCSRSVFNFAKVDSGDIKDFGLYDYPLLPASGMNYNPIQGWSDQRASLRLQQHNARLGAFKQVHMMILVFVNKPVEAAILQEGYWKGGNKNEFTLCIGLRGNKIEWARAISWTEVDELKIRVQQTVMGMPLDLVKISDYMAGEVRKQFIRKQFKDFSYITVEPTNTAVLITFIITILITAGICIFVVKNDWDHE